MKRYNEIIQEQFKIQGIVERMGTVDKMTKYCGNPSPRWLRSMIIKLYKKMTEIRIHAEKKVQEDFTTRKRLQSNSPNVV